MQKLVVAALHKCGTNLVRNLVKHLGWEPFGHGISESYQELHSLTSGVVSRLGVSASTIEANMISELSWQARVMFSHYTQSAPGPRALFVHMFPLGHYLTEWSEKGSPRVVFLYRDPRARLWSLICYLMGEANAPATNTPWTSAQAKILKSMQTDDARWQYGMRHLANLEEVYSQHAWMLHHPDVCALSYEELVGVSGGGSRDRQMAAIGRLLAHLDLGGDPERLTEVLYSNKSRTFRSGSIAEWTGRVSSSLLAETAERWRDVLEEYGYDPS